MQNSTSPNEETRNLKRAEARTLGSGADHYSAFVGPPELWDIVGAAQFRLLTALGLREHHKLLDVGCGALRAGRLFLPYLNKGCYFGIEPNTWLIEDAIRHELGAEFMAMKAPVFSDSANFEARKFNVAFDFILANSIFSHAGPEMLEQALEEFAESLAPGGLILLTLLRSDLRPTIPVEVPGWTYPHCTTFRPETLERLISEAGLVGRMIPWYHPLQQWYAIARTEHDLPASEHDRHLRGALLRVPGMEASLSEIG